MSKISTKEARDQLSTVISRAAFAKERVILTRHGKAIAAVVPIEDIELLEELENRIDLEDARAALAEIKKEGTISWKAIKDELNL
jgi:prevent-host-death family protein